jgi:hypothetical protein
LKNRDFRGSIALNIACYTGVTGRWFEEDWGVGKVVQRQVPTDESFCLNILKTGVAGYVAYACPRPAGPSMLGDSMRIAISGQSLGELRRQDGNSTVLSHLQQGFDGLQFKEWTADAPINATRKTQDLLISMSTGGLLFGDPGCTPFSAKENTDPRSLETSVHGDVLSATVRISGPLWHFFCADQITMWDDKTPSYRIETVIPIGNRYPKSVRLKNSSFGDVPHQLIAAVEEHNDKRLLHLKASFKQPAIQELMKLSQRGVSGSFEVTLSDEEKSDTIRIGERR